MARGRDCGPLRAGGRASAACARSTLETDHAQWLARTSCLPAIPGEPPHPACGVGPRWGIRKNEAGRHRHYSDRYLAWPRTRRKQSPLESKIGEQIDHENGRGPAGDRDAYTGLRVGDGTWTQRLFGAFARRLDRVSGCAARSGISAHDRRAGARIGAGKVFERSAGGPTDCDPGADDPKRRIEPWFKAYRSRPLTSLIAT